MWNLVPYTKNGAKKWNWKVGAKEEHSAYFANF